MEQSPPPMPSPVPAKKPVGPMGIVLAIIVLALLIGGMISGQDKTTPPVARDATAPPAAQMAMAPAEKPEPSKPSDHGITVKAAAKDETSPSRKTISGNTFGCVSVEAFHDASSYWQNDERELMAQLLDSGQCELLRKGDPVILVDVAFMKHIVVRRPGEATKLVTFLSAVD